MKRFVLLFVALFVLSGPALKAQETPTKKFIPPHGPTRPVPPPRNAIVLFDGKNTDAWTQLDGSPVKWDVSDGVLTVKPGTGNIITKQKFGDYHLHVEFRIPYMPDAHGQARGNSGVYNHGLYEVQILDSVNNPTYFAGGCGAIYGQRDPDENAALPPGQWQSYDIIFRAPRFDANGHLIEKPRITVIWNGVKVHDNVEIQGPTTASLPGPMVATGPIMLQDHGCPVSFRDIWIVPLKNALPNPPKKADK
ncbi:protein of unknown function (DUF1080) [Chthonomonas calidirosea]|uniref:3-keto-disaccharide hydrolase n=1 Tax=Chthonomonas calidirosea TaxID=454171 RepID=UPI0006DD5636|nr:DUF1080 domain-containing protein [Chthonomonas calidirosea]CEK17245.1 protein of unknown function (DUF1080) [Chthonomonas calidirosea]